MIDWHDIKIQIPESEDPHGPIHLIKTSFQSNQEPYELIEKELDQFILDLQKQFQEKV